MQWGDSVGLNLPWPFGNGVPAGVNTVAVWLMVRIG